MRSAVIAPTTARSRAFWMAFRFRLKLAIVSGVLWFVLGSLSTGFGVWLGRTLFS